MLIGSLSSLVRHAHKDRQGSKKEREQQTNQRRIVPTRSSIYPIESNATGPRNVATDKLTSWWPASSSSKPASKAALSSSSESEPPWFGISSLLHLGRAPLSQTCDCEAAVALAGSSGLSSSCRSGAHQCRSVKGRERCGRWRDRKRMDGEDELGKEEKVGFGNIKCQFYK